MKIIGLLGRISLLMNGKEQEVVPGQLVFCLPPAGLVEKWMLN